MTLNVNYTHKAGVGGGRVFWSHKDGPLHVRMGFPSCGRCSCLSQIRLFCQTQNLWILVPHLEPASLNYGLFSSGKSELGVFWVLSKLKRTPGFWHCGLRFCVNLWRSSECCIQWTSVRRNPGVSHTESQAPLISTANMALPLTRAKLAGSEGES